jgi:hypothetical protein
MRSGFRLKEKAADIMETLEKEPDDCFGRITAAEQWEYSPYLTNRRTSSENILHF